MPAFIPSALLLVLTLCLGACGFHLRGTQQSASPLAFKALYIQAMPGGVGDALRQALEPRSDLRLAASPDQADAVLTLDQEGVDKQIMSVNRSGRVSEYEMIYRLRGSLSLQGVEVIPPTALRLRRDYSFDDNNLLGKDAEEQILIRDMRSDAAQQILRRLAAVKPRSAGAAPATPARP